MNKFGVTGVFLCVTLVSCQATTKSELTKTDIKDDIKVSTVVDETSKINNPNSDASKTADLLITGVQGEGADDKSVLIDNTAVGSIKPLQTSRIESGVIRAYVPPKKGTVFTWRNNWASLPEIIAYRVDGVVKLGDTKYVKFTSTRGLKKSTHAFYNVNDFSLKGYRDAKNAALVTYKPAEQRYKFPMKPGDKWVTSWKSMDHKKKEVTSGGGVVQVMKFETLNISAGKFETVKVKMPLQRGAPRGMSHYVWFSPKLGVTVKEQIGSGSMNWTQVLESVKLPS